LFFIANKPCQPFAIDCSTTAVWSVPNAASLRWAAGMDAGFNGLRTCLR
jgi:hypothetical protein